MGMVVFNRDLNCFQGRVWDRKGRKFHEIERIETLGRAIRFIEREPQMPTQTDAMFARHLLIPGWDQAKLGKLKVFIAGLGGNGTWILQALINMGVGRKGWIKGCDPDSVEPSNLPRIPYAGRGDVGQSKATVAARYGRFKSPKTRRRFLPYPLQDPRCQQHAKEAHLLIGAVDNNAARELLNWLSVRYLIPLVDTAAEIIPNDESCEAGAQVRVIAPGEDACMICTGQLDLSEGSVEELSPEEQEARRRVGYVRGLEETPTPSVLHLNGVAALLAVSHIQRMAFGEDMEGKSFLHYDRQQCQLTAAALPQPNENCPVCGRYGELGLGDNGLEEQQDESGQNCVIRFKNGQSGKTEAKEDQERNVKELSVEIQQERME